MNKMKLFEAIDLIDDDLIREAGIPSEKLSENSATEQENAVTVSGVEVRSGIRWQRIAALASAFILIAGFGAVGALLYKNRPPRQIEPSEIIIPAATESTTETADKQSESTEAATTNTQKTSKAEKKETKESTNTVTTDKTDNKPERVDCYNDEKAQTPAVTEPEKPADTPTERTTAEPAKTLPAPTTQKPVTTAKTTTTTAKTTAPKVTEPEPTTDDWVIHLPCTKMSNVTWRSYQCPEMFEILRSINYRQITAAEFAVTEYEMPNTYLIDADDNNRVYALNFDHKWVMRYGTDGTDCGDAPMPDRLYELFCGS